MLEFFFVTLILTLTMNITICRQPQCDCDTCYTAISIYLQVYRRYSCTGTSKQTKYKGLECRQNLEGFPDRRFYYSVGDRSSRMFKNLKYKRKRRSCDRYSKFCFYTVFCNCNVYVGRMCFSLIKKLATKILYFRY